MALLPHMRHTRHIRALPPCHRALNAPGAAMAQAAPGKTRGQPRDRHHGVNAAKSAGPPSLSRPETGCGIEPVNMPDTNVPMRRDVENEHSSRERTGNAFLDTLRHGSLPIRIVTSSRSSSRCRRKMSREREHTRRQRRSKLLNQNQVKSKKICVIIMLVSKKPNSRHFLALAKERVLG